MSRISDLAIDFGMWVLGYEKEGINTEAWKAATQIGGHPGVDSFEGSVPMFNGKPLDPDLFGGSSVRIVPANGNYYRMEIVSGATRMDVEDKYGMVLFFDLVKLMEAMR